MIEILDKKSKIIGFIDGNKFLNKKHKLIGFLDDDIVKDDNGHNILRIDKHDDIFMGKEQVGFILDSKIYYREKPIFEFSKEKKEVHTNDGKEVLILKGNHQQIEDRDLFGIATIYLKSKWWNEIYY